MSHASGLEGARANARAIETQCRSLAEDIRTDITDLAGEVGLANKSLLSSDAHKELAEQVEQLARTDAILEMKLDALKKAMVTVVKDVDARLATRSRGGEAAEREEDIKDYTAQLLAQVEEGMEGADAKVLESKIYKETMKLITGVDEDDEDVVMPPAPVSLICPLTKARFLKPVKSKHCGHTYDEKAIKGHIIRSGTTKCPVAGCPHTVTTDGLVPNKKMERQLRIASHTRGDDLSAHEAENVDDDDLDETYV